MTEAWDDIAEWWIAAVRDDPGQSSDTHDVLDELLVGTSGTTLELGCGEGQGMRQLSSRGSGSVIGVDVSLGLLRRAQRAGAVVRARLPDLSWARSDVADRAVSVGLLDLIADHERFFAETARVVRAGGHLVVVINHPVATSPGSASLVDPDGEILWRWGAYLAPGTQPEVVEGRTVELFHRPIGALLTAAAAAGWGLEAMVERGPSAATIELSDEMHGHEHIPSIAGFRWRRH